MYCYIIPFWKTFDNIGFTYSIPDNLVIDIMLWQVIEIPFKNDVIYWIVYNIFDNLDSTINKESIRDIISIKNDFSVIDSYRLYLLKFISDHYFYTDS